MAKSLTVGHIDLSFHKASCLEVEKVLKRHGFEVQRRAAPHEDMFELLKNDEIDLLVSAWLPASHDLYLRPIADKVTKLTVLYEPYCIWGVPDYVSELEVRSVDDLKKPASLDRMDKLIQGINPGAGISRFSEKMIDSYGLRQFGYRFNAGSEADCFDRFEQFYAAQRWLVIPLWHPQYLHNRYKIRALEEPQGLLGGSDQATLVVRNAAKDKIGHSALKALSAMYLGNAKVSALDDQLQRAHA
ncbi:glycine betaine ABC transporter substrate-binding protein [Thalassospira sp. MCCC 1A02491]|uniref:glycine betaine ABC transporter substrate-binding protein n=1 Tax=Thalassospira sp. MCCC 1A02491 TaxID=1769751 RepID=UPI0007AD73BA|nr:glycine betaine ABC transporter substrate-binding protein [Thalassospira sp. MCCC 1A02491]KZB61475.1 glycine/betaine ABC transporter substrate-binding protein [Thalassospira sp. MCCC 1A02491]